MNSLALVDTDDISSIFSQEYKPVIKSKTEIKELFSEDTPYTLSIYQTDFPEDKDKIRFVKACERMIRTSPEYKEWSNYLKEVLQKYTCAITKEVNFETSVEIHHHPYTLYDIVTAIINRFVASNKEFCSFDIVREVLELHYEDKIGYIPLISSIHEKYHNGYLQIPMGLVSGKWTEFRNEYSSFIDDESLKEISNRTSINFENCNWNNYNWSKSKYNSSKDE